MKGDFNSNKAKIKAKAESDEAKVRMKVNDGWVEGVAKPETTLLQFLRDNGFTEVKKSCEEGECGACTVILDGKAVPSCLVLAKQADGGEVLTVKNEGDELLDRLKEAFVKYEALQCGFCTPGMLMTARWFLEKNPNPTREKIKDVISGNLCRCTGYKKVIDAIEHASRSLKA